MPIPTDTLWNIRKLNWVFAGSALALVVVTAWTIVQDYGGPWRSNQQQARVWEAAFANDRLTRDLSPEHKQQLADLEQKTAAAQTELEERNADYKKLSEQIVALQSESQRRDFKLKTDKANVTVDETHLQDAITAGDQKAIAHLSEE